MGGIKDFRDLIVWQKARLLVVAIYEMTKSFPKEQLYGLTLQIRRSAVSVPSNIAEGYGRGTRRDYIHFLQIARGSLYELQTQVILSMDLKFVCGDGAAIVESLIDESSRLLHGLLNSLSPTKDELQ